MVNENDITKELDASDDDVVSLKKDHYKENAGQTRMAAPVPAAPAGLNQELVNMLSLGKKSAQFQGIDRCIRVVEPGTPNQRHCMAMMINNLSTNTRGCSSCDRIKDANANPKVINSSMIRLSQKELEECGLKADPLLNAKSAEVVQPVSKRKGAVKVNTEKPVRRVKVAVPNSVKIEISMNELANNDILQVLLKKTLEAVYELPITKFSEAEAIRGTSEKLKALLNNTEMQGE